MTAADWTAIAEWVLAAGVLAGVVSWGWRQRTTAIAWFTRRWRRQVRAVLESEVAAGAAWESVTQAPEVSMEAGMAYARTAAQSGHPPYTVTQGLATPDQALEYLLAKTAETLWEAVSSAQSELEPYLVPVRNYMNARRKGRADPVARPRPRRAHRTRPPGRGRLARPARRSARQADGARNR